ncbi:MAG: hypothetical protein QMD96_06510 [Anaerosomatales bacterium]|nr:hypothetical protein [Anaerosomatales bacterium]
MPSLPRRFALVAHCLLDPLAKVRGITNSDDGVQTVAALIGEGVALVQLPCPEITYLGARRWGMTYEQYDVPAFRKHCRDLLQPIVDTVAALIDGGAVIDRLVGIDGSPSCGVSKTCRGYSGGEPEAVYGATETAQHAQISAGPGVFVEVLLDMLRERGVEPPISGVPEDSL